MVSGLLLKRHVSANLECLVFGRPFGRVGRMFGRISPLKVSGDIEAPSCGKNCENRNRNLLMAGRVCNMENIETLGVEINELTY